MKWLLRLTALVVCAGIGIGIAYYQGHTQGETASKAAPSFEKRQQPELTVTLTRDEPVPSSWHPLTETMMLIRFLGFKDGDATRLRFEKDGEETVVEVTKDPLLTPLFTNPDIRVKDTDTMNGTVTFVYRPDY